MTNTTENQLALASPAPVMIQQPNNTAFANASSFELAQRMARALTSSNLVPTTFQGDANIGSAMIALEIAQRLGSSPLMVMQNLNVINGRPAWSSQFIIAALNSCGRFSSLRFEVTGEGDEKGCVAWVYDKASGDRLDGPPVSIAMAKAEGWYSKAGSKWKTMPDLMLRYRAAAFFGRLYAPDILMGMQSVEEVVDVGERNRRTRTASEVNFEAPVVDQPTDVTKDILFVDIIQEEPVKEQEAPEMTKKEIAEGIKGLLERDAISKETLLEVLKNNDLAPKDATMLNQVSIEDLQYTFLNWEKVKSFIPQEVVASE
jgi:hypothetical protein